tara:strand:- start:114 stop:329 length:216 start_codon:yes stop_codon:yes gene_type:complete
MAITFNFTQKITLADGNEIRIKDDSAVGGFLLLAVKIGAGAYQELKLSGLEATRVARIFGSLQAIKSQDQA